MIKTIKDTGTGIDGLPYSAWNNAPDFFLESCMTYIFYLALLTSILMKWVIFLILDLCF